MKENSKIAIIGAGIAGVSAAVYAKRAGLDFSIFEGTGVGGQLLFVEKVDNYVGLVSGTKGSDLTKSLIDTLSELDISLTNEVVNKVELDKGVRINSKYEFDGMIVATGASFKKLGIKGEAEFSGKGVSYCAICDGFFFRKKDVAVIGGGNSAIEEALYLSEICNKVYLIHRRNSLRGMQYLQKELLSKSNIEVVFDSVVKEITGSEAVEAIALENVTDNSKKAINLSGVFVAVGINPNTEFLKDLVSLDEYGFITTDNGMKSSCDFLWAAGDCRKRPLRQLITAASEGAIAAINAYKHLKGHYISS
ncbi:MAG: FAD-dependent oxidoreductase [Candidatus Omnitrophica bacterium]|nr:FAD-dependent oxidoreductase [Candidatus Omnitrophota bacterium]